LPIARKAAVSLLICVVLFAGFCFISFTSLFDKIETRFYDRTILNRLINELDGNAVFIDAYLEELQQRFSDVLRERAIRNSFWVNQDSEDIYERSRILSSLGISLPGLQWIRFIDAEGNRIHFSTNPDDQIRSGTETILYKNYPEVSGYIPFDQQLLFGMNMRRVVFDEENERLIFYYPFYDSMDIRRGEALFSVSINAFSELLIENMQVTVRDDISVISNPNGIVIGVLPLDTVSFKNAISSIWATGNPAFNRIYAPDTTSNPMTLLSVKTSQDIFVGRVVSEKLFALPATLKALMIGAVFITLFVLLFLIINIKQDAVAIVQNRLKELQVSLMNEYYQLMGDMDWAVWRRELEQRRDDVKEELCRGVKIKKGGDIEGYINSFFNKSWDALLSAIGSRTGMITTFDEAKLEAILSRVLSSKNNINTDDNLQPESDAEFENEDSGEFEELEELEGADESEYADFDDEQNTVKNPEPLAETPAPPDEAGKDDERRQNIEREDVDNEPAAQKAAAVKELYDLTEFEDADTKPAKPPADISQTEKILSNHAIPGSTPYDVEEFGEVEDESAPALNHLPDISASAPDYDDINDIDVEKFCLDETKIFEDFSTSPKPDFNNISLHTYTPSSIYSNEDTDSGLAVDGDEGDAEEPASQTDPLLPQYEGIPELDGNGDEGYAEEPAAQTDPLLPQYADIPEIGGNDDEGYAEEPGDSELEDTAWLKLTGETALMEPKEGWTELPEDYAAEKPAVEAAGENVEQAAGMIFSSILEEDPFGSEAFKYADETGHYQDGLLDAGVPAYGEFISFTTANDIKNEPPHNARKTNLSVDPLYDVEEFVEADEDDTGEEAAAARPAAKTGGVDDYTFETLRKGTDINEIAKKIEFTPVSNKPAQDVPDIEIDLASPSELFSIENMQDDNKPPPEQASVKTEPKTPRKQTQAQQTKTPRKQTPVQAKSKEARKQAPVKIEPKTPRKQTRAQQTKAPRKQTPVQTKPSEPRKQAPAPVNRPPQYQTPQYRPPQYRDFLFTANRGELEYLEAADPDEEKQVIKKNRSGVAYIDPAALKNAGVNTKNVDPAMKNLVDSVLHN
jgi:hypothetical protein